MYTKPASDLQPGLRPLSTSEIDAVSGGPIVIAIPAIVVKVAKVTAAFAGGAAAGATAAVAVDAAVDAVD
jgi:hypothetical protein